MIPGGVDPLFLSTAGVGGPGPLGPCESSYPIDYSLRLRTLSSNLTRNCVASPTNPSKYTLSCWVKNSKSYLALFGANAGPYPAQNDDLTVQWGNADGSIGYNGTTDIYGSNRGAIATIAKFRDPSAWYHIVWAFDNGFKIYVNGILQQYTTSTTVASPILNSAGSTQKIGNQSYGTSTFINGDGVYVAEYHFIDGQTLSADNFGEFTPCGNWVPKAYAGTYGANGFYLKFDDASSVAALGTDSSGNNNHFTSINSISLTAGDTYDWMLDSPTNNYATLNTLNTNGTLSKAASTFTCAAGNTAIFGTMAASGKMYYEATVDSLGSGTSSSAGIIVGITSDASRVPSAGVGNANDYAYAGFSGLKYVLGAQSAYGSAWETVGKVVGVAVDMVNGKIWFSVDGVWQASGDPVTGLNPAASGIDTSKSWVPVIGDNSADRNPVMTANFGQRAFAYTPPTGFQSFCTKNMPTPIISMSKQHMDVKTYTGNGANLQVGEIQKAVDLATIQNSLRFKGTGNNLTKTLAAGNTQKFTFATWVKVIDATQEIDLFRSGVIDPYNYSNLIIAAPSTTNPYCIRYGSFVTGSPGSSIGPPTVVAYVSTSLRANINEWMHVTLQVDTTQAVAADRVKIFMDGVRQTSFTSNDYGLVYPPLNASNIWMNGANNHAICSNTGGTNGQNYLAQTVFVDGQALDATAFGQFDANGYFVAKSEAAIRSSVGAFGTNGFLLMYNDASSAPALGYDRKVSDVGTGNDWTVTGMNVTPNTSGYDSFFDTPTNVYPTIAFGDLFTGSASALSLEAGYAGLKFGRSDGASNVTYRSYAPEEFSVSRGKFIFGTRPFEVGGGLSYTSSNHLTFGIDTKPQAPIGYTSVYGESRTDGSLRFAVNHSANQISIGGSDGTYISSAMTMPSASNLPVIALDLDNGKFWAGWVNGSTGVTTWYNGGDPSTGINPSMNIPIGQKYYFVYECNQDTGGGYLWNGAQGWPSGFVRPTGFQDVSENNISEFLYDVEKPDLAWIKSRSAATNHMIFDSARGVNKYLSSNLTAAETTDVNSLQLFDKNGFHVGNNTDVNTLNASYAAWLWKAGGPTVANTQGTIASQVSVNSSAGISVVSYMGTGANATVGHGLNVAPSMIIVRNRVTSIYSWEVYHKNLTSATYHLRLQTTDAQMLDSTIWNGAAPISNVFLIGTGHTVGDTIAYCFAEVPGFSKFGSYVGNGSTDGPFIYCGFRPRFIMAKRIDGGIEPWVIEDTARSRYNIELAILQPHTSTTEDSQVTNTTDMLSNGFKPRSNSSFWNTTGATYIFAAFAEIPFKYANAR